MITEINLTYADDSNIRWAIGAIEAVETGGDRDKKSTETLRKIRTAFRRTCDDS